MNKTRILVTGGAGYIGSHVVRFLVEEGHDLLVVDDLSQGHREAVPAKAKFLQVNLLESEELRRAMLEHKTELVMHFAAFSRVADGESDPANYYKNNLIGGLSLLEAMRSAGVKCFVLSSTAAVYGMPHATPILEDHPCQPINVYGRTKLMLETILDDYRKAYGLGFVALRYFNAAGAWPDGSLGEDHEPESHLIPRILDVPLGRRPHIGVNGTDYPTPDGTCIRDYIHVVDLAAAHALALQKVQPGQGFIYNVGSESGFSVSEVIAACEKVTDQKIRTVFGPRRAGDPAMLVASQQKIMKELGWKPKYSDLNTIIKHAWQWHQRFKGRPIGNES